MRRYVERVRDRTRLAAERRREDRALRRRVCQTATWRWFSISDGHFRFIFPGEHHGHLASTAHVQAAYPFVTQDEFGNYGIIVGLNLYGGWFALDPWREYELGRLHDANLMILGLKDHGKTSLAKTWAYRQNAIGRRVEVLDRKSEYGAVIAAMGGVVIRLAPGVRLNPLERIGSIASRQSLLRAVTRALLNRDLTPDEKVGLAAALNVVDGRFDDHITIPLVVEELRDPAVAIAEELNLVRSGSADTLGRRQRQARDDAAEKLRECMLVLRDMSIGPLGGMFDGPTTGGDHVWDRDAISIDISGIAQHTYGADENTALALTMVCTTAFLDGRRDARKDGKKTSRINDEAWRALSVAGATEYYTAALKLARQTGEQHILLLHKLSDLSAVGDTGSRTQKLAEGLAAECATRVVYCQDEQEVDLTARSLNLTSTERELIAGLPQGDALWRVGQRGFLVRHQIAGAEWDLVQTDDAMGTRAPRVVGERWREPSHNKREET